MPAHLETRSLTFEQARSFLYDIRSIWYASLPSLCHELSNDVLDCIVFFIVNSNLTKILSTVVAWKLLARAVKSATAQHQTFDRQS